MKLSEEVRNDAEVSGGGDVADILLNIADRIAALEKELADSFEKTKQIVSAGLLREGKLEKELADAKERHDTIMLRQTQLNTQVIEERDQLKGELKKEKTKWQNRHERKIIEYQLRFEKERDTLKARITELERHADCHYEHTSR